MPKLNSDNQLMISQAQFIILYEAYLGDKTQEAFINITNGNNLETFNKLFHRLFTLGYPPTEMVKLAAHKAGSHTLKAAFHYFNGLNELKKSSYYVKNALFPEFDAATITTILLYDDGIKSLGELLKNFVALKQKGYEMHTLIETASQPNASTEILALLDKQPPVASVSPAQHQPKSISLEDMVLEIPHHQSSTSEAQTNRYPVKRKEYDSDTVDIDKKRKTETQDIQAGHCIIAPNLSLTEVKADSNANNPFAFFSTDTDSLPSTHTYQQSETSVQDSNDLPTLESNEDYQNWLKMLKEELDNSIAPNHSEQSTSFNFT